MRIVELEHADDESIFGGKAFSLARSLRAGLNVPPGLALDVAAVDALSSDAPPMHVVDEIIDRLGAGRYAVRSSAIGEDSESASFAGQHVTRLGVRGRERILDAIRDVHASGRTVSALAYRRQLGLDETPRVAIVVQKMIDADRAGVLFTVDPVTGADERVVEASWGLGEAVVAGLVTPDRWRMRRGGEVFESELGEKDVEIVSTDDGSSEHPVDHDRRGRLCLDDDDLIELETLASQCESYFDGPSDIEWGFEGRTLYLLQRRAVTR